MLVETFSSVINANCRDALWRELVAFTERLGFERMNAMMATDGTGGPTFQNIDNTPEAYRESFESLENGQRDPVMSHCRRSNTPIAWDQSTYTSVGLGPKWEEQAPHGYRTGIACALHLPNGRHFLMGVDRRESLPTSTEKVMRLTADLQLFAVHAVDSLVRVLSPVRSTDETMDLTPREREALRWTMEGKTAWEVGRILGISEQTAVRHLNHAMHKLDCVNKHQAVVKALRLGLID